MSQRLPALFLAGSMCALPSLVIAGQAALEVPPLTVRTSTRLVLVDVIVTDKNGHPIQGLRANDFSVEENGNEQKVSFFVPPSQTKRTEPAPTAPGTLSNHPETVGPSGVPIVLILDAANSRFQEQAYARSQMLKYAAEQSQTGYRIAILSLTDRLHVLQQFTNDPRELSSAISKFMPQAQILQAAPAAPRSALSTVTSGQRAGMASTLARQNQAKAFASTQNTYNLERRTVITLDAMGALARMLGGLRGRKNVVWLTSDLPFDLAPENRSNRDSESIANFPSGSLNKTAGLRGAGMMSEEQRLRYSNEIRAAEARLADASIAIYPVDLRGLVVTAGSNDRASQGTMEEIAAETGGKAYINQNEIRDGIILAAEDGEASYELGYYPENKDWDGKYRNIKVKLAQGDMQLRYRKGYFAVNTTTPAKNTHYDQDVAAALQLRAPITQISFMAQSKATDAGKMRVVFLVDAHTVMAEDSSGAKKFDVSLYACIFDKNGKMLTNRRTMVDRAFDAATYQQIAEKGMMVPIELDVPKGGTELRLAVLDNKTGYIGTVSGPLGQ